MRAKSIPMLITLLVTTAFSQAPSRVPEWVSSLDEAFQISKDLGRPVFVEYWAVWCHYCKDLEIEFETNEFQRVLSQFVKVKINFDVERELVRRYQVRTLPTTLVLDDRGNVIMKSVGLTQRTVLLRRLAAAQAAYRDYLAQREESDDPQVLKSRADYLLVSGYPEGAIEILEGLLSRLPPEERSLADEAKFSLAFGYFGVRSYASAAEIFKELADRAASSQLRKDAKEALKMAEELQVLPGSVGPEANGDRR